jgi:phenylacetate-coenzyme A ligase PaaK-like adenylate-forming protein
MHSPFICNFFIRIEEISMLETGIRQMRMAMSMALGRRPSTANLARLVEDALSTLDEFGEPGADTAAVLDGPGADPAAQPELVADSLRRTATRLADRSPFYARRFAAAELQPRRFDADALRRVPVTTKRDLIARPAEFRCAGIAPYLATRTTGTTGRPAEIWLSRYELEVWSGLGALGAVLRQDLRRDDMLQISVSSRATAAVHLNAATCRLVGAGCRVLGVVPPDEALDALAADGATVLLTCPSYLGELVIAARRRGLGPADFRLRRIDASGEVLSPSLAAAARQTFGVAEVKDNFGMTEVIPVTGRLCSAGHLHFDAAMGHVEILDLDTGEPAAPGALGTLAITPYYPYRECMPVFRYDTRDVVQALPHEALGCEAATVPASGRVLGKADGLLRLPSGAVVTPRELVEAVESLPTCPWPARFRAAVVGGRLVVTLPDSTVAGLGFAGTREHLAAHGVKADLAVVDDADARSLRPVRSDLHETTFVSALQPIGA